MSEATVVPKRSEVPEQLTWDLTTIYRTDDDWEKDFKRVESALPELESYKGRLGESGEVLLQALDRIEEISRIHGKLYVYAEMHSHEDTKVDKYRGMSDRAGMLGTQLSTAVSYMTPEMVALGPEKIDAFMESTEGLRIHRHSFNEMFRLRDHTRSDEVSKVLAQAGEITGGPDTIYSALCDSDMKLPMINMPDGTQQQLTNGNYGEIFLDHPDREVRRQAFMGMMGTYNQYRTTLAALYAQSVKGDIFSKETHLFDSSRQEAMKGINVDESIYDNLIATVDANLHSLHRYLALSKRALGLPELEMFDIYFPFVGDVEYKITYSEAQDVLFKALAPLGEEYVNVVRKAFTERWIDVMENENKHSGAYSWGTYDTNPFILMNFQGKLDSLSTLAHELGHSMHSYFTRRCQPAIYGSYTLFVAEVASIVNEMLLAHYLLQTITDPEMRKYIIHSELEKIRGTLFRQTMFAEFERETHARNEAGEPLTADVLCEIHKKLNDKYFGPVVKVNPEIEIEWARIPHFYSAFYVYQYATGIATAISLVKQILTEGQPAVDRYLKFLSSGDSDYSLNLLKAAGVDLSTPAPIQQALDVFAEYVTELEKLL